MDDSTERQFQKANAAVDKTVTAFVEKLEALLGKWDAVAPTYLRDRALLSLCDKVTKLVDDPVLADGMGPAMLQLSNALADFRDSRYEDRERA